MIEYPTGCIHDLGRGREKRSAGEHALLNAYNPQFKDFCTISRATCLKTSRLSLSVMLRDIPLVDISSASILIYLNPTSQIYILNFVCKYCVYLYMRKYYDMSFKARCISKASNDRLACFTEGFGYVLGVGPMTMHIAVA